LPYDHPSSLGALGVNGTPHSYRFARDADVVIGVGTRWTDVTSVSQTVFAHPSVRFVNLNIASFDAHKYSGVPLVGDARATIDRLITILGDYQVDLRYREEVTAANRDWDGEVTRWYHLDNAPLPSQGEVVGAVNDAAGSRDVVVCSAGSLPNDLHKLWRSQDPKSYHVEYGYSCMGYEIPGGIGVKMAAPEREVFVMVGDGSYMMMPSELATAVQDGIKIIVILIQNHGFASVGALSERIGTDRFGARYRRREDGGELTGDRLPVDLAANAASFGVNVIRANSISALRSALEEAKAAEVTTLIEVETDPTAGPPRFHWWDVPIAEVSESQSVRAARRVYDENRATVRRHL
jgi:3D-(3,5/4)-trihydroxycyclohexane-1,2-dione acylhydrolase (decyclizing)